MHPFEERLAQCWPPHAWHELTVLVAVSGGPDSVALLRALAAIKGGGAGRLVVAHCNHLLRGAASDEDEQFVIQLTDELGLPCEIGRAKVSAIATEQGDGLEAAARAARYEFLKTAAEQVGARYVATGHTADDQVETILHRMIRGTGLAGLAGIPRARLLTPALSLIRPLLEFRRNDVIAYLSDLGQPFRTDASNRDGQLTRNRIRHELLPLLTADYNRGVQEALLRLGQIAGDVQAAVDAWTRDEFERRVQLRSERGRELASIDLTGIASLPRHIVRELFIAMWRDQSWPEQAMGFAQWEQLAGMALTKLLPGGSLPAITLPGGIRAWRELDKLILTLERLAQ